MKQQTHLNGELAWVIAWNDTTNRVEVATGSKFYSLKKENLRKCNSTKGETVVANILKDLFP